MEPLRTPPPRGHQGPGADAHPPTNAPPTHTILTQNWAWETPTLNTRLLVVPNGPRPRAAPLDKPADGTRRRFTPHERRGLYKCWGPLAVLCSSVTEAGWSSYPPPPPPPPPRRARTCNTGVWKSSAGGRACEDTWHEQNKAKTRPTNWVASEASGVDEYALGTLVHTRRVRSKCPVYRSARWPMPWSPCGLHRHAAIRGRGLTPTRPPTLHPPTPS
mmetsp:Transcript_109256/g.185514  ORF Transcript_109256/g.185514 Transcript_109256/m.185514 type:complete len:217 (-) Transcript_109256:232-882(-)